MANLHVITGLDIGTSSIKALVAAKKPDSPVLEVLAQDEIPSFGIRRGVVVNIEDVSKNIHKILGRLQDKSRQKSDNLYVNIGGSHISVIPSRGSIAVSRADQKISQEDIDRVIQNAQTISLSLNKEILDVFPQEFIVDKERGIKEALDMKGVKLEVEVLLLCVFSPYLRNLTEACLNSGFQIADVVFSPLASSRAVLSSQQKELGVAVVDIGAGTTSIAVFEEGILIHAAVFPVGSENITNDIAIGLCSDVNTAEAIKRKFGTCILKKSGKKEKATFAKEFPSLVFSHKTLVKIIEARVSEIFDLVNKELKKISRQGLLPAGIVLTGGGSKLPGIVELAKKELKLPVQIGIPQGLVGIEESPALSTVCGLVLGGADLEEEPGHLTFGKEIITRLKRMFRTFIP